MKKLFTYTMILILLFQFIPLKNASAAASTTVDQDDCQTYVEDMIAAIQSMMDSISYFEGILGETASPDLVRDTIKMDHETLNQYLADFTLLTKTCGDQATKEQLSKLQSFSKTFVELYQKSWANKINPKTTSDAYKSYKLLKDLPSMYLGSKSTTNAYKLFTEADKILGFKTTLVKTGITAGMKESLRNWLSPGGNYQSLTAEEKKAYDKVTTDMINIFTEYSLKGLKADSKLISLYMLDMTIHMTQAGIETVDALGKGLGNGDRITTSIAPTLFVKIYASGASSSTNTPVKLYVNGKLTKLNSLVIVKNGVPFVPAKELFSKLNIKMIWDAKKMTSTVKTGKTTVIITNNSKSYTVNGKKKTLTQAPFLFKGTEYIPLQLLEQGLYIHTVWNSSAREIYL